MTRRFIELEYDRKQLYRFIAAQKLPFSITIERGRKRTIDQNRLQRLWMNEIAEQLGDRTAEEVRGYCKLVHGVPIMLHADEKFAKEYEEVVAPLPYEHREKLMRVPLDMPVTRLMNTAQHGQCLDAIYREFTELGIVLTQPKDDLLDFGPTKASDPDSFASAADSISAPQERVGA